MQTPFNNIDSFYSHPLFQAYFKTSPRSLIIKAEAPLFTIVAVSDNYLSIIHREPEEILHANFFEVLPGYDADPTHYDALFASFMRVMVNKATDEIEILVSETSNEDTGEKETQHWLVVNEPILDDNGEVCYIFHTAVNKTVQVLAEKAIEKAGTYKADFARASEQKQSATDDNFSPKMLTDELKRTSEREQILIEELSASNEKTLLFNEKLLAANAQLQAMYDALLQTYIRLSMAEERVHLSTEAANIGTFAIELVSGKFDVSQRTCEIFGVKPGNDLSLEDFVPLMDEADRDRVTSSINRAITLTNSHYFEEYAVIRKNDGVKRWVRALGNTRTLGEDRMRVFAGVVIDITEQKDNEYKKQDVAETIINQLKAPPVFAVGCAARHYNANQQQRIPFRAY